MNTSVCFWKKVFVLFTSSVKPTRRMTSFWLLNICRQCLKSDRLGNTFPPQGSFNILQKNNDWISAWISLTDMFPDHRDRNILTLLFLIQQINNKKSEMFVHPGHVEQHEIFLINTHKLSLYREHEMVFLGTKCSPPTIRPLLVKFNCKYFPNRLEFWFIQVWALPNASNKGDV